MNIEETVVFILQTQAQTSETLQHITEKLDALAEGQKKFDRSLVGIRKLIVTGMKMIVANGRAAKDNERAIKNLAAAQAKTDRQLKVLLASMEKGRNGRNHS